MDEKISIKALDDYSDDYASKVTARFFAQQPRISGPEILKLSPIAQVNLFVISELLSAWKHELQKLRSPYFDYTHPDVAAELSRFQNLLSNHISIARENFQPLLKKAASQTLYLILDPYDFYARVLEQPGRDQLSVDELKQEVKYLRINRAPLEKLLQKIEQSNRSTISSGEAFSLLDKILEEVNFAPEDVEGYIAQFSEVVPVPVESFYETPAKAKKPKVQPAVANVPLFEEPARETKASLADSFQKEKVRKIKDSLTINQKFMFTKILFHGDFEIFTQAIDRLDSFDNLNQALRYVEASYPEWDLESEEYQEFLDILKMRYA